MEEDSTQDEREEERVGSGGSVDDRATGAKAFFPGCIASALSPERRTVTSRQI
jgi:methyl coenzyme M reductase subunit C